MDYLEIEIEAVSDEIKGMLIATLTELGFHGYEEERFKLKAYIATRDFDGALFNDFIRRGKFNFSISEIKSRNWNEAWESSFEPVMVNDFCAIRASFHAPVDDVRHEIIITPKMSFGTGHHATTFMMVASMEKMNFHEKTVFDFGTGTAVLAILAEKLGAKKVYAIDNDDWSIENARENITANNCSKISLSKLGTLDGKEKYDIILANINRNVILDHILDMNNHLAPGGIIVLSGLLDSDLTEIDTKARAIGLKLLDTLQKHNWIALHYGSTMNFT